MQSKDGLKNLNIPHVKKWIAALRSGKYKQATNYLQSGTGYCCLGVAQKLARDPIEFESDTSLSEKAQKWLGLEDGAKIEFYACDPSIGKLMASQWNDNREKSFSEIADLIEKHWLGIKPIKPKKVKNAKKNNS